MEGHTFLFGIFGCFDTSIVPNLKGVFLSSCGLFTYYFASNPLAVLVRVLFSGAKVESLIIVGAGLFVSILVCNIIHRLLDCFCLRKII
jgi:hypothetical protein